MPVHRQGEGDLLEIGTMILEETVGRLDGTTAQKRRGQTRGRGEEAVQRILLFGALKPVGLIEAPGRGVEVHEGEVHLLFEPKAEPPGGECGRARSRRRRRGLVPDNRR